MPIESTAEKIKDRQKLQQKYRTSNMESASRTIRQPKFPVIMRKIGLGVGVILFLATLFGGDVNDDPIR